MNASSTALIARMCPFRRVKQYRHDGRGFRREGPFARDHISFGQTASAMVAATSSEHLLPRRHALPLSSASLASSLARRSNTPRDGRRGPLPASPECWRSALTGEESNGKSTRSSRKFFSLANRANPYPLYDEARQRPLTRQYHGRQVVSTHAGIRNFYVRSPPQLRGTNPEPVYKPGRPAACRT
jgi:hypothetical protein